MALKTKWLLSKIKSPSCPMVGVYRALAFCPGCCVIFHGPLGCAHVGQTMDLGSGFRVIADNGADLLTPAPLISSNLREKDGIFGGIGRLEDCISYVVETYTPRCIFVVTSCVAGVIGDDVEEAAKEAEARHGIPVIAMPFAGFLGGEYGDGYYETANLVISHFFEKREKVPGRVLLLGDQMGPEGQYGVEVRRLLSLFGLSAAYQFPGYVPAAEWGDISSCEFSVVLGAADRSAGLLKLAKRLEDEYGIRTLGDVYPVGFSETKRWTAALAKMLGVPEKGAEIIASETKRIEAAAAAFLPVTRGKKLVIGTGRSTKWYNPAETLASVSALQMNVSGIVFYGNLTEAEKAEIREKCAAFPEVPFYEADAGKEIMDEADVLLTTNEIFETPAKQLFIPMVPQAGTEGEILFLRAMYRLLCRYGKKGGVAYVTV